MGPRQEERGLRPARTRLSQAVYVNTHEMTMQLQRSDSEADRESHDPSTPKLVERGFNACEYLTLPCKDLTLPCTPL